MKVSDSGDINAFLRDLKNNTQAVIALAVILFVLDGVFVLRWQFASMGRLL